MQAVKRDSRMYIQRYTSPNKKIEYGYPHSNALLQFPLKLWRRKPHKATHHPTECDIINDVKLFSNTVAFFNVIQSNAVLQKQMH